MKKFNIVKDWVIDRWKHFVAWLVSAPAVIWAALKWPYLIVGLATIPVENFLSKRFHMSPVMGRITRFITFMALLLVSWWAMEIIIVLAAKAVQEELFLLYKKVRERFNSTQIPVGNLSEAL
jgi:hypothetical protein